MVTEGPIERRQRFPFIQCACIVVLHYQDIIGDDGFHHLASSEVWSRQQVSGRTNINNINNNDNNKKHYNSNNNKINSGMKQGPTQA